MRKVGDLRELLDSNKKLQWENQVDILQLLQKVYYGRPQYLIRLKQKGKSSWWNIHETRDYNKAIHLLKAELEKRRMS